MRWKRKTTNTENSLKLKSFGMSKLLCLFVLWYCSRTWKLTMMKHPKISPFTSVIPKIRVRVPSCPNMSRQFFSVFTSFISIRNRIQILLLTENMSLDYIELSEIYECNWTKYIKALSNVHGLTFLDDVYWSQLCIHQKTSIGHAASKERKQKRMPREREERMKTKWGSRFWQSLGLLKVFLFWNIYGSQMYV